MICSSLSTALAGLILFAVSLSAADLTQLNRKITRESAYKSKPKYYLLVFGAQVKTRFWVVLDEDTLYVDRNSNSDLTDVRPFMCLAKRARRHASRRTAGN